MKKLIFLVVNLLLSTACSVAPSKGTRWPSSFYKKKAPCSDIVSEIVSKKKNKKSSPKPNNLSLLRSGKLVQDEDQI